MTYHHIVLFKIREDVGDEQYQLALDLLTDLGRDNPDILEWTLVPSVDARKGRVIVEDAIFTSEEAFQLFRSSDKHQQAAALMREIADWLVGDYIQ